MEKYQINQPFSLCLLSQFQISKQLWIQLDVKQSLGQCIEENKRWAKHESTPSQNALRTVISRKIDEFLLPAPVKKDLRLVVELMGMRIRNWALEELVENSELYIDHIHWTIYGFIDSSATFRSLYVSKILPEDDDTWEKLCGHCLEDCITDLWPKISGFLGRQSPGFHSVMSFYWCCRMQNGLEEKHEDLIEMIENYNEEHSLEENLFMDSLQASHAYPKVKYFWRLLNYDQKKKIIIDRAQELVASLEFQHEVGDIFHDENDEGLDFLIFLFRELSLYEPNALWIGLLQFENVLVQLLKWPCLDVFREALKESREHHELKDFSLILMGILRYIDRLFSTAGADGPYRILFHEVWETVLRDGWEYLNFMGVLIPLWSMRETAWLSNIINDSRLTVLRDRHGNVLMQSFARWPRLSDPVFFEEVIAEVLVSDEEREKFRTDLIHERGRISEPQRYLDDRLL